MNDETIQIAPSILAADFGRLAEEIRAAEAGGAGLVHLDVMDGHFVPNLTIGPSVVASVRPVTRLPFDVHLMVTDPAAFVEPFRDAGADRITFHVEAVDDPLALAARIRELGARPGLSLNPDTPLAAAAPYLGAVDLLLVMTVHPGFGGQAFRTDVVPKLRDASDLKQRDELELDIEVDGGVNLETVGTVVEAGAEILVAGSAVFGGDDAGERTRALLEAARAAAAGR